MGCLDGAAGTLHVWWIFDAQDPRLAAGAKTGGHEKMGAADPSRLAAKHLPGGTCSDRLSRIERGGPSATQTVGIGGVDTHGQSMADAQKSSSSETPEPGKSGIHVIKVKIGTVTKELLTRKFWNAGCGRQTELWRRVYSRPSDNIAYAPTP